MDVRTIITEALSRANIVPRRQPAPGDLVMSAHQLLMGIVSRYNNDNYLAFTQAQIDLPSCRYIHIFDQQNTMLGENNRLFNSEEELQSHQPDGSDVEENVWAMVKDLPFVWVATDVDGEPQWVKDETPDQFDPRYQELYLYSKCYHVRVSNVAKLNSLHVNRGDIYGMFKLNFLPRADFDSYRMNELYWTWTERGQGEWFIEVKPYVTSASKKLRLTYNKSVEVNLDTDLRIPDAYIELLITSLTYALAVKYPRMDDVQVQRLKQEMASMIDNVRTPKADSRMVVREDGYADDSGTPEGVLRGKGLFF